MEVFIAPANLHLAADATTIRGRGAEPRHSPVFGGTGEYLDIVTQGTDSFTYEFRGAQLAVRLRSAASFVQMLEPIQGALYIDITALSHHIWAPILRTALQRDIPIRVIYIEPETYQQSPAGLEGEIFDLSERIMGVAAIPGFASLGDDDDRVCFVPMLGFEGRRTAYILEQVQPKGDNIVPVVGLPGFRPEFPFYTLQANARILKETQAWKNVVYAAANNPFSAFDILVDIAGRNPDALIKIAPIGTKPHALGAFLYPLKTARRVEFVYDFPIRKANRTAGVGKVFVYRISEFMRNAA